MNEKEIHETKISQSVNTILEKSAGHGTRKLTHCIYGLAEWHNTKAVLEHSSANEHAWGQTYHLLDTVLDTTDE